MAGGAAGLVACRGKHEELAHVIQSASRENVLQRVAAALGRGATSEQILTACFALLLEKGADWEDVHALLVVRGDLVRGLITSYDIQGDRPLILLRSPSYRPADPIEVRQIMTRWDLVPTLDWSWVNAAPVFDLARAFRRTGATHVVIVENVKHQGAFVRALISRRRLIRQLGLD